MRDMHLETSKSDSIPRLRLYRGNQLLGELTPTDDDMPWHFGSFTPTPAFEESMVAILSRRGLWYLGRK